MDETGVFKVMRVCAQPDSGRHTGYQGNVVVVVVVLGDSAFDGSPATAGRVTHGCARVG